MPMVFTLISALKESAEQLILERQTAVQDAKDAEAAKAEEEENRKFVGEAVTKESFLRWREEFRAEQEELERKRREEREEELRKKRGRAEEEKLTGRQLWERGLAGKGDEEEDEAEESEVVTGVEGLKV